MKKKIDIEILKKYSAKNRKKAISEKYKFGKEWVLFAFRLNKNTFFKRTVSDWQENICPVCSEAIENPYLHHISYDHICQRGENITRPRINSKERICNMPNCEVCLSETPEFFQSCAANTVIVHQECHKFLHCKKFLR